MKCYGALLGFILPWQQLGSVLQRLDSFTVTLFVFFFFLAFCRSPSFSPLVHVCTYTITHTQMKPRWLLHELYSNLIKSPNGFFVGRSLMCVCVCV